MKDRSPSSPADRPPSILSPHGEGYCRHCQFIIGLNERGLLDAHRRGASAASRYGVDTDREACKGSGRAPAAVTPYASRKAAFRVSSPDAWCAECRRSVKTTRRAGAVCYRWHEYPLVAGYPRRVTAPSCPNSYYPVPR